MPRLPRAVFAGLPHHVTQRGNRRDDVFFDDDDRLLYLKLLGEYARKRSLRIYSWCLMTNHVHLVAVPQKEDSLHLTLKPVHMRYTQQLNRKNDWQGHLWQGRYFSCALDEEHLWSAVRYVETNPVRAGLVERAEDYRWSSARVRCLGVEDKVLWKRWPGKDRPEDWSEWLKEGVPQREVELLRRNTQKGLPCGKNRFIKRLERMAGRVLHFRPRGRPKKRAGRGANKG